MEAIETTRAVRSLRFCLAAALALGLAAPAGATGVLVKAPNVRLYTNQSYGSLELDHPVPRGTKIKGYSVLDWRDAHYLGGQYGDWSVNQPGYITGYENEIWLKYGGHKAWTVTQVRSSVVSIHLHGDSNDGVAEIYVDALMVARVDMQNSSPDNVLVIVKNLPFTTHEIKVVATSPAHPDDVALIGAAALESDLLEPGNNHPLDSRPPRPQRRTPTIASQASGATLALNLDQGPGFAGAAFAVYARPAGGSEDPWTDAVLLDFGTLDSLGRAHWSVDVAPGFDPELTGWTFDVAAFVAGPDGEPRALAPTLEVSLTE